MVSAAEQLAANLNFGAFAKAEELKKRIWFTLAALVVYRCRHLHPDPRHQSGGLRRVLQAAVLRHPRHVQHVRRGAVERMAIFALNIMPYISASIIMQLMTQRRADARGAEEGRASRAASRSTSIRATHRGAGAFQAYGIAYGLEGSRGSSGPVVIEAGWFFRVSTVVTLVGGTMFLMWLGEQITARGVGNGTSLIIMAGIVAGLPSALAGLLELSRQGAISWPLLIALLALMLAVVAAIVFIERAQRRLLVQYPKRQMGNRMFQGDASHLPSKLNSSGVIPPIFASSLLLLPITVAQFSAGQGPEWLNYIVAALGRGQPPLSLGLCGVDRLLRVLLHGHRLQSARHGRQLAQVRRLPAGLPARGEDRRAYRLRPHPHHRGRAPCIWRPSACCPSC
jgi:preprotein translocase subunit SecY